MTATQPLMYNHDYIQIKAPSGTIGTTCMHRNVVLFDTLIDEIEKLNKPCPTVLFHACSVGYEPLSFWKQWLQKSNKLSYMPFVSITDKEEHFLTLARENTQDFKTEVLPAANFLTWTPDTTYDVVVVLHALVYCSKIEQSLAIGKIASYNNDILCCSGFHRHSIASDLVNNDYLPITTNKQDIYNAWHHRGYIQEEQDLPAGVYADWRLPPYQGLSYADCALFKKVHP